jgi:hypothetical protein
MYNQYFEITSLGEEMVSCAEATSWILTGDVNSLAGWSAWQFSGSDGHLIVHGDGRKQVNEFKEFHQPAKCLVTT